MFICVDNFYLIVFGGFPFRSWNETKQLESTMIYDIMWNAIWIIFRNTVVINKYGNALSDD